MRFGPVPVSEAAGAVLAHSVQLPDGRLRKGRVLTAEDVAALTGAGLGEVVALRLGPGDVAENAAAEALAKALLQGETGLSADAAFTGRVNLRSTGPGILAVNAAAVARINAVDPAITLATLPEWQRVTAAHDGRDGQDHSLCGAGRGVGGRRGRGPRRAATAEAGVAQRGADPDGIAGAGGRSGEGRRGDTRPACRARRGTGRGRNRAP